MYQQPKQSQNDHTNKLRSWKMASHKKTLNVILWNATSVKNKITKLHGFLSDHNAHVVINTET